MTEPKRPLHLATFLGASAGAYALLLATVTGAQSAADARVAADRGPVFASVEAVARDHDRLEAALGAASAAYGDAAGTYDALGARIAALEEGLGSLETAVTQIQGASNALPARVALPRVSRTVVTGSRPVVHATTGASGRK